MEAINIHNRRQNHRKYCFPFSSEHTYPRERKK